MARAGGRCLPCGAGRGRDLLGALPALALYAAVAAAVWEFGGYDVALRPALSSAFGAPFETYFWYRTRMDYLSSFFGAVFAAALPSVVAVWVVGDRSKTAKGAAAAAAAALAAAGVLAWATHAKPAAYRDVQPYVGTLWVPLYALLRNATPALRNSVSRPLEWVAVWKSTTGLGGPHQTSELSISIKSKSIRLIFGRIDCFRRVLEAQRKSLVQIVRLRPH